MTEVGAFSSDEEIVTVPPFVPSTVPETMTSITRNSSPAVEIAFSNLTKESCMKIKMALLKWALGNEEFTPEQDTCTDSKGEVLLSGKFRYESDPGNTPRIIYIPPMQPLLTESELKDSWAVNEAIEKVMETPLYERRLPQLPRISNENYGKAMRPVQHHSCFHCKSYHHQIKTCPRKKSQEIFQRRSSESGGNGEPSSSTINGRNRGRPPRGRAPRSQPGRYTSSQEEPARYLNQSLSFKKESGLERKRSRSMEGSRREQEDSNEIPLIKIMPDSDDEDEGSEEGEYVENKRPRKGKSEALELSENEIEEGEIVVSPPPSAPVLPIPKDATASSFLVASSLIVERSTIPMLQQIPPPPPPRPQLVVHSMTHGYSPFPLQRPPSVITIPPPPLANRQPSTLIYVPQSPTLGPNQVFNTVARPTTPHVQQTIQLYRPTLGHGNVVVPTRPSPTLTTTLVQGNTTFLRPLYAAMNTNGGGGGVQQFRGNQSSGMVLLDRNGKPLIVRPRPR